jgi:hypothetical protein
MKTDNEQTPPKLVYLRDRVSRAAPRPRKAAHKAVVRPGDELASEAIWLGRSLFVIATTIGVYCLLVFSGSVVIPGGEVRQWLLSLLIGDLFVGSAAAAGGILLLRESKRAAVHVSFAAGALIVVALEGLTHLVVSGDLGELTLTARLEVLLRSAAMAVGVWAISYVVRAQKRQPPS